MVTSRDVAKLAGVSVATVSRVYSDSNAVTDITARKVLDAARQLGYKMCIRDSYYAVLLRYVFCVFFCYFPAFLCFYHVCGAFQPIFHYLPFAVAFYRPEMCIRDSASRVQPGVLSLG